MTKRWKGWPAIGVTLLVVGCGGATTPAQDGGAGADSSVADAGPEPCTDEGAMRTRACGNCGTMAEKCVGGLWEPQSQCLGEAECPAASVETGSLPLCGMQQRICDETCHWLDWQVIQEGTGECEPSAMGTAPTDCPPPQFRQQTCSMECMWVPSGECMDGCGDTARKTPADAEEICVPAGMFNRGDDFDMWDDERPAREVYVSAFYIDRYPATNRRYRECVEAGPCVLPADAGAAGLVTDGMHDEYPVIGLTWDQTQTFCAWDDRRLVTEAEWEKSARGPTPRDNDWPWDGAEFRCDLFPVDECGATFSFPLDPITSLPGARSYYGVDLLIGGGYEWVSDWYDPAYYQSTDSLIDPTGPATGTQRVYRGNWRSSAMSPPEQIDFRWPATPTSGQGTPRCGRDADL